MKMSATLQETQRTPVALPETERIPRTKTLRTARGLPETLAEIYHSTCGEETHDHLLYVFDVGNMFKVQKENDGTYIESYRFVSRQPRDIKWEIEDRAERAERYLKFMESGAGIYRVILRDDVLQDITGILSDMQRRYS